MVTILIVVAVALLLIIVLAAVGLRKSMRLRKTIENAKPSGRPSRKGTRSANMQPAP